MPLTSFYSCPSKNGMGTTELGVILYCPLLHSVPRYRAGGGMLLLATAETPGFLGNLVGEKGAGGDMAPLRVEVSFYKCFLPKATAIPFSASLRFKPKAVFLYLKKKKKESKNQTQHLTSCNTWSFSLSFSLPFHLSFHMSFPYWLVCLLLFSLPIRDNLGGW